MQVTLKTPETDSDQAVKTRRCLLCRNPFPSEWVGDRVCRKCKATAAWRNG